MDVGIVLLIWVFMLGAVVGSFLNVCICRLPEGKSLLRPASHCPICCHPIRWRDNIPLLSYLILKGRCRDCGARISLRYFVVELLTATLFVLLLLVFLSRGEPAYCIATYMALACVLIVASFIDLEHMIIPDELTLPGIVLAPLLSVFFLALHDFPAAQRYPAQILSNAHLNGLANSVFGMAAGAGFIFLLRVLGGLVFRKEAMGWGDVKYMAMIGGFFGWKLVTIANLVAPVFGSLVGLALLLTKGEHRIPYGPFLSLGALTVMIWGPDMLLWVRMHYFPLYQAYPG